MGLGLVEAASSWTTTTTTGVVNLLLLLLTFNFACLSCTTLGSPATIQLILSLSSDYCVLEDCTVDDLEDWVRSRALNQTDLWYGTRVTGRRRAVYTSR